MKIHRSCIVGIYKSHPEIVKIYRSLIEQAHKAALIYIDKHGTIGLLKPLSPHKKSFIHEDYAFECFIVENEDTLHTSPDRAMLPEYERGAVGQKRKATESDQRIAADHYNQLTRDKESRFTSQIFHLRNLNGCIKSILIQNTLSSMSLGSFKVLDLCCGHGGDINKWLNNAAHECKEYVGVDIAHAALNDFISNRLEQHRNKSKVSKLITADMGKDSLTTDCLPTYLMERKSWMNIPPLSESECFDLISCQFAIHYMFQSHDRAKHFFTEIQRHLRVGGRFIVTTVDSRVFMELVMKQISESTKVLDLHSDLEISVENELQNTILRIRVESSTLQRLLSGDTNDLFGLRYNFQLFDQPASSTAAVDAPEWLVPLPLIEKLASEANLGVKEITNFHDYISAASEGRHRYLLNEMHYDDGNILYLAS